MFKPVRVIATVVLFASIGLVLVGAFVLHNGVGIGRILFHLERLLIYPLLSTQVLCLSELSLFFSSLYHIFLTISFFFMAVFVIIEFLAYTWYTLSYIPYARTAVLKVIGMG